MNEIIDHIMNPPSGVWLMVFMLIGLLALRQLRADLKPIFTNIIDGVAKNAGRNSVAYATAIAFGLSASLSAWVDAFKELSSAQAAQMSAWQFSAIFANILNPFIVAMLAYAYRNQPKDGTTTTPPFP